MWFKSKAQADDKNINRNRVFVKIRETKIHVYGKRQTADLSWEFLRIENRQIKTVQNNS